MSKLIDAINSEDFKEEKEKWQDYNYGQEIRELKNPTNWKSMIKRKYVLWSPFKSMDQEIEKLVEKDRVQSDVIEALEDLEDGMERYRDALDDYWKIKYGELSKLKN